ncbi:MAG: hypothetical protein HY278_08325 [candidate division NC10 bacterium]|nr:hypothetical protein [candidate division NC10 bacterium]
MEQAALLSLIAAPVAFTLSEATVFADMRERVKSWNPGLGKIAGCGYCLGHWAAFGLVAIYRARLFQTWWLLDYFLTALIIAWLAAFQWAALCWLMDKAGK